MFDPLTVITIFLLYIGCLFLIALWVEWKAGEGKSPANNAFVYSISLAVYCTSWTYYGSVGKAATSGMLFLTIYLGPTLAILLWGTVQRLGQQKEQSGGYEQKDQGGDDIAGVGSLALSPGLDR